MPKWTSFATFSICLAVAASLPACKSGQPPPDFTAEHYSGGIKILSWSGRVSGRVIVAYSPYALEYRQSWGARMVGSNAQRHADMPQAPGFCYIDTEGSPLKAVILSQPTTENTYTCEILIFNPSDEPMACEFGLYFLPHGEGL